jgi:alpha-beta hydrolase superfamily lysophospholipase
MPDDKVRAYYQRLGDESFRSYLDELGLNLVRTKRIKIPLLVIGARNDAIITPGMVHATARRYGRTAEIFPDMAHDVMLELGWEKVANRVSTWLKEQGI